MDGITLHPTLGVNPHLTFCPNCGGETNELLLSGSVNSIWKCKSCGMNHIGYPKGGECQKCHSYDVEHLRELYDSEKLPGNLCDSCEKQVAEFRAEVKAGGVYWKCSDCPATGVIKAESDFAKNVRKQLHIAAPWECGVEFTKADCPACREKT